MLMLYQCIDKNISAKLILDKVDDIEALASAIFSHWRYFNHWAYISSEINEYRDWFVKMLEKLKELALKV